MRLNDLTSVTTLLNTRRSALVKHIGAPGLNDEEIDWVIQVGSRVPDHGKLLPWRFVVIEGDARTAFPDHLADWAQTRGYRGKQLRQIRRLGEGAPTLITVLFRPQPKAAIPLIEQQLSVGAACQNMLLAATSMGYAGQWLSAKAAYEEGAACLVGGKSSDTIAGFLFFGTQTGPIRERERPSLEDISWRLNRLEPVKPEKRRLFSWRKR